MLKTAEEAKARELKEKQTEDEAQEERRLRRNRKIEKVLDHWITVTFMTLVTIYALFFDDIRIIAFEVETDDIFYGITLMGIIAYTLEILFASWVKKEYLNSFFFWLDLISTLSMIPDCLWIWKYVIGVESGGSQSSALSLAKTSKSGRVTRVIRVIRLIRLIRIVKLYKQSQIARQKAMEITKISRQNSQKKDKKGLANPRRTS